MHPGCLKLVSIIQKRKLKIPATTANNVLSKDEKNAYNAPYIRKKLGEFGRNGRVYSIPTQAIWVDLEKGRVPSGCGSLEWLPCRKFASISEFRAKKNTGLKEQTPAIDSEGNPKAVGDFGNIPPGQNSLKIGKTPYFPNVSKIREIIYFVGGACALKSYRYWGNYLYKAGYAEAPVQSINQRLLTLEELESAGQF